LIRPGRVDYKQYIGPLTSYQTEQMLIRFYPEANRQEIDEFQQRIHKLTKNYSKDISAAQLQGFFMQNKESLTQMFKHLDQSIQL
jgi:ATP-dependent Zn protease